MIKEGFKMDEIKIDFNETGENLFVDGTIGAGINFTPPEYFCPIHGKVTEAMIFTYYTEKRQVLFCMRCYEEFLKKHVSVLMEGDLDELKF
jgi:hypothetical protein